MNHMQPDSMPDKPIGRLRKYHSNFYYVELSGELYECSLRGLLKKEGTEPLVGDAVELDSLDPAQRTARIHQVLARKNAITRPKMANVDQVLIVYSLHEPSFDPNQLDRYLTHIELAGLTPVINISKADLAKEKQETENISTLYTQKLGFQVIFTSIHDSQTLKPILELAQGKISVLAGPSGAGKSSLLNALNPGLQLRVGDVSEKIGRGQHTTRHVELIALHPGDDRTLIADTPGFSNLKFNYVLPVQIEGIFRDFAPFRADCAFSDCLHIDEEGCAVLAHVDEISPSRYQSYRAMIEEARLYKEETQSSSQKEEFGYKKLDRKGKDSVRILRLKDKDRDLSRRALRQQVSLMDGDEPPEDDDLDADNFDIAEEGPDSV